MDYISERIYNLYSNELNKERLVDNISERIYHKEDNYNLEKNYNTVIDLYMGLLPSYAVFAYNRQQQIHTGDCKQFNESLKRASQLYALFSHK